MAQEGDQIGRSLFVYKFFVSKVEKPVGSVFLYIDATINA